MRPLVEQALRAVEGQQQSAREFDVRLFELHSELQARRLQARELDVAICYALDNRFAVGAGIEELCITEQPYALVVPKHACAGGKPLLPALAQLHYVRLPSRFSQEAARSCQHWLQMKYHEPGHTVDCKLATEVIAYAASGRGYGFLPALWRTASHDGAQFLPLPSATQPVRIAAYWSRHVTPWVTQFRHCLSMAAHNAFEDLPPRAP